MKGGSLFSPFVLTTDLVFLLGSKVVLDVEGLADLLGGLALDHVCDGLAADVEKGLDIEVVGGLYQLVRSSINKTWQIFDWQTYQNNLKQHLLVNLHELLVPLVNLCGAAAVVVVLASALGIVLVVSAPFNDLLQDGFVDVGNGDRLFGFAQIFQ